MRTHPARFVAGASAPAHFPEFDTPEIAFVGRSNVGKSSLLNRLVGRRGLARVSKTPGRTQQINFFVVDEAMSFADLPGYGFARVPLEVQQAWKGLVEGYLRARRQLRAVCALVDIRRGVAADDIALLEFLDALELPWFLAATKVDKLARGVWLARQRELAAALDGATVVACSASSGEGIAALWTEIERAAQAAPRRMPRKPAARLSPE